VKTQIDSVKLTNLRLSHGVATKLDVLQAQQVLDTANASIPDLERQIAQEEDAISILLGNYPQAVPRGLPLVAQTLPPKYRPAFPPPSSSGVLIFARRNRTWWRRTPKSA
jgi:multidrug efflux system outer membrane protein